MRIKETRSIALKGRAGQGVKLAGYILAQLLAKEGYNVALTSEYDAFARSGKSEAFIVFSKGVIENPIVEKADINYDFGDEELQKKLLENGIDRRSLNMALLGMIAKELNLKKASAEVLSYLPRTNFEENKIAFEKGLKLQS